MVAIFIAYITHCYYTTDTIIKFIIRFVVSILSKYTLMQQYRIMALQNNIIMYCCMREYCNKIMQFIDAHSTALVTTWQFLNFYGSVFPAYKYLYLYTNTNIMANY